MSAAKGNSANVNGNMHTISVQTPMRKPEIITVAATNDALPVTVIDAYLPDVKDGDNGAKVYRVLNGPGCAAPGQVKAGVKVDPEFWRAADPADLRAAIISHIREMVAAVNAIDREGATLGKITRYFASTLTEGTWAKFITSKSQHLRMLAGDPYMQPLVKPAKVSKISAARLDVLTKAHAALVAAGIKGLPSLADFVATALATETAVTPEN